MTEPSPQTKPGTSARRVTKRRAETRARLLKAAFEVFAERGFGRTRIEQVCERAGYTSGAFYSQFASLDELFLALYEQRADVFLADLHALEEIEIPDVQLTLRDSIAVVLAAAHIDDNWYLVGTDFGLHAIRNQPLGQLVADRNQELGAAMVPLFEKLLARVGRAVIDPEAFAQAVIAVDAGTTLQHLLTPNDPVTKERRLDLFEIVVNAYTEQINGGAQKPPH